MSEKTVRDVLEAHVRELSDQRDIEPAVDAILRELRDVLSTGDQWVTREVPARKLEPGDVIVSKDRRLWSVTALAEDDRGDVSPELVRGDAIQTPSFDPNRPIPTLLTRTDDRALSILERELGATPVGREVA